MIEMLKTIATRKVATAVVAAALLVGSGSALYAQQDAPTPAAAPAGATDLQLLVAAIQKELQPLACTAAPEDIEAAIVFAISQREAPPALVPAALREIELQRTCFGGQGRAISRVRTALLSYGNKTGTAALGGNEFLGTGSIFTTPTINVGGGSANYGS